jgi:hypothetical protein
VYTADVQKKLPELIDLEKILQNITAKARVSIVAHVEHEGLKLPLHKIVMGSADPKAPVLALSGGVHGLERIGSQVILAILKSLSELISWDEVINHALESVRLVFVPIVNPMGMMNKTRSNANGVDIMRNAPVDAGAEASFLLGGHRFSNRLPWYRGEIGRPPEVETQALIDSFQQEIFQSQTAISVDFHSGFGVVDRLWFPYARTTKPFPELAELHALKALFDRTYPNHFYQVEPQAKSYTTHGDVWDYLYDAYRAQTAHGVYMPLTLEMGSWLWVKKNPSQFFSTLGPFNPVMPHRKQRILRRHNTLFEFLIRSIQAPKKWAQLLPEARAEHEKLAMDRWY